MQRPLNIHPDIWRQAIEQKKEEKSSNQQIQLDEITKLNNSIDMIIQGLYIFKTTYNKVNMQQYSQQYQQIFKKINELLDTALIPYTVDIVKQLNKLNEDANEQE